jgi:hypothetical protein
VRPVIRLLVLAGALLSLTAAPADAAPLKVHWLRGYAAPGTPAKFNRLGVIEVGPRTAHNLLVLEIYAFGARLGGAGVCSTPAPWPPNRASRPATCC